MIVTCGECSTSFQLDETRIPASGARVRCSRCKHAFFLAHPSSSQAEAVHSVAAEAAADPSAAAPGAAEDLSSGMPGAAEGLGESVPEFDEEEEWQFSEEVRVEGDDPEDDLDDPLAESDAPFSNEVSPEEREKIFGESSVFEAGFDDAALDSASSPDLDTASDEPAVAAEASMDDGGGSGLELDGPDPPAAAAAEPARDESGFGTVDDFSSLMEEDPDEAGVDLDGEAVGELDDGAGASPGVGTYAEKGATDDLGDPESWDLVGGDDIGAARPSLASVSRSFTDGIGDPVSADEFFGGGDSEFDDLDQLEGFGLPKMISVPLGIAARTIGWAVTLGLIGAFLFFGGRAELGRWSQAPQQASIGGFEVATEEAGWVETSRAGYVLRFTGRVRNAGNAPLWPGTVQLVLLDGAGERIIAAPVLAGTPMAPRILREAPTARLASVTTAAIHRFASQPLAPGEERRFEALVPEADLPPQAQRVLLEVGEPSTRPDVASPARSVAGSTIDEAARGRADFRGAGAEGARAGAEGAGARAESARTVGEPSGVQPPDEPGLSP